MKNVMLALGLGLGLAGGVPAAAEARGAIESACLRSDRPAANRVLCGCIQRVADAVLTSGDQRKGARFFADPELSQTAKMARGEADLRFWQKWEAFSDGAVKNCQ
jgi:hypothetical protein